jgi:hypothetical protein
MAHNFPNLKRKVQKIMFQSRKCSRPGCKAWAMHGKDYCSAHRPGGIPGAGAPRGNVNALKHGLYARSLADKIQEYVDHPEGQTIDVELLLIHTVNKYVATCLRELMTSTNGPDHGAISRLARTLYLGSHQTLRLLKVKQETPPDLDSFLDELNEIADWEMKL